MFQSRLHLINQWPGRRNRKRWKVEATETEEIPKHEEQQQVENHLVDQACCCCCCCCCTRRRSCNTIQDGIAETATTTTTTTATNTCCLSMSYHQSETQHMISYLLCIASCLEPTPSPCLCKKQETCFLKNKIGQIGQIGIKPQE